MSILSPYTGYGDYKHIDDETGKEIEGVIWVDDLTLDYAVIDCGGTWPVSKIVKVSRVTVNHAAREIHVNEPKLQVIQVSMLGQKLHDPRGCDECCDEVRCCRIGQCMRFKTAFGEVCKP